MMRRDTSDLPNKPITALCPCQARAFASPIMVNFRKITPVEFKNIIDYFRTGGDFGVYGAYGNTRPLQQLLKRNGLGAITTKQVEGREDEYQHPPFRCVTVAHRSNEPHPDLTLIFKDPL